MFSGHERFFASCIELRTFLSHVPLKLRTERPAPKPKRKAFRAEKYIDDDAALAAALAAEEAELRDETVAADLLRRSGRDAHKTDPSDTKLLREAVAELRRVWNGKEPKGEWRLDQNASGVGGLLICSNFLSADEVEALRTVYGAHRAWGHYAYGSTGRHNELASVVQRIDFGPRQMRAEGIVSGSPMWRLGSVRQEMLSLIEERLRYVCSAAGLWQATRPDTLQLTKIGCAQKLDNHWDRRDRWQEGIASIAWSELPCEGDVRGESWTLVMEKGSRKELQSVQVEMQPGSAYVLTGVAQGTTKVCERGCVGHNRCTCCWTHGVQVSRESMATRQSMTLRVLADSDDESDDDDDGGDRGGGAAGSGGSGGGGGNGGGEGGGSSGTETTVGSGGDEGGGEAAEAANGANGHGAPQDDVEDDVDEEEDEPSIVLEAAVVAAD